MFNLTSYKRLFRYQSKRWRNQIKLFKNPVLRSVLSRGYCVIPDYWSPNQCKNARDAIEESLIKPKVKIWQDPIGSDHRIMGAENVSSSLDLINDPYVNNLIEQLYGVHSLSKFTMAAKLTAKLGNKGSGQGWHRDSSFVYQFKAILYLSDVDTRHGPFQYYGNSGNALSMLSLENKCGFSVDKNRFTDEEILQANLVGKKEFCSQQGTLLLVNTRGIHRGKPIAEGTRYALTNYYWPISIPPHISEFVN